MKKALLVGGPRDGLEMEVRRGATSIDIPVRAANGWTTTVYRQAAVLVAGVNVGEVFIHEGRRPARKAALQAIARLFLAGSFRQ